jgi:hypothetical protein
MLFQFIFKNCHSEKSPAIVKNCHQNRRQNHHQNLLLKFVVKICPQNLSPKFVAKICRQNLSPKFVIKICRQNLSSKFVVKICRQKSSLSHLLVTFRFLFNARSQILPAMNLVFLQEHQLRLAGGQTPGGQ